MRELDSHDPLSARLDQARSALAEPPWGELRETRVLGRVLEATRQQRARRIRRYLLAAGSTAALGLAAAAALVLWPAAEPSPATEVAARPERPAVTPRASRPPVPESSVLSFSDGSRAELAQGAKVHAEQQSASRVQLRQEAGRVRYQVTPDPQRQFVVTAGQVTVRVLGTAFSVELDEDGVRVVVERGSVEVQDRERLVELSRGEQLLVFTEEPAVPAEQAERPLPRPREQRSAQALMAAADRARQRGELAEAARSLAELVRMHGEDPRAVSAWFTLGRVERARGRHSAAARAFEACRRRSPGGSLAEDALAEAAHAWAEAGNARRAGAAAARYLRVYARGTHAARMRELLR